MATLCEPFEIVVPQHRLEPEGFLDYSMSFPERRSFARPLLYSDCRDLTVTYMRLAECTVMSQYPAARLMEPLPLGTDDELIEKIQGCFRYKDHSREECLAVVRALAPQRPHHPLPLAERWPLLPAGGYVRLVIKNPTDKVAWVSGILRGAKVIERASAAPSALNIESD